MLWDVMLHDFVSVTSQMTEILYYTSVKISNSNIKLGRRQVAQVQTLLKVIIYVFSFYYYFVPYVCHIVSATLNCLVFHNYYMARSSYSTVPDSKMDWRPFILTEVFCCVLYFLSSAGCHRPKRTYSLHHPKRTYSLQYVQGMMF